MLFVAKAHLSLTRCSATILGLSCLSICCRNRFVQLEKLPVTENGKINRKNLPEPEPNNLVVSEEVAESFVEQELRSILEGLLRVSAIGRDDNFFMLGGHSFVAAQLIARVRSTFKVELGLRTVFEHPTVAAMAQEIEEQILTKL